MYNKKILSQSHNLEASEVVHLLETDLKLGLTNKEAERRSKEFGLNRITTHTGTPLWKIFARQFQEPLVYILLIAAVVTGIFDKFVDASVIFGVIFINAIAGFIQEVKAEKALKGLSQFVVTKVIVRREGQKKSISAEDLVPGDVVIISRGDRLPADLRLFKVQSLQVDESTLTGESASVHKHCDPLALDTVLADRKNLAFASTFVTEGYGEGIVWAIGDQTEIGRIAWLVSESEEIATPLTKKLAEFSKRLLWLIIGLALLTFVVGLLHGEKKVEMFMASVALAVAAIPEGLPPAVTIMLAIGVTRMAKRRAIVRKLPAVEALGSTTVICSDKTGTLTENQMTVLKVFAGEQTYDVTGIGYNPRGKLQLGGNPISIQEHEPLLECLRAGVLCNDAEVVFEGGQYKVQGDPTEAAMLVIAEKAGILHFEEHRLAPRIDMIPFEPEHMYRATLHESAQGKRIYKVGALERILERCQDMVNSEGDIIPINKNIIQAAQDSMAALGLRVIAFARKFVHNEQNEAFKLHHEHVQEGLTFLGLQGMIDPPRPEAIRAVEKCQRAGIAVKMITGDHALTACAIAEKMGFEGSRRKGRLLFLTGRELEKISQEKLIEQIEDVTVFARISPEQKLRIVKALQAKGHIIAMTGDGVNDAPALKQADVGIAMGIGVTDIAKEAADVILTDNNFATIEAAVEEGRGIFDTLLKFLFWTLPTNIGEALILMIAILFGITLPVLPVQILWVNMTTSIFLGLTLAFEHKEKGLMKRGPRDPSQPILTFEFFMRTAFVCLIMVIGSFWLFFYESRMGEQSFAVARTAVINVIVLVELAYLFNCRSLVFSIFKVGAFSNHFAIAGSLATLCLQLLFTYAPIMNELFQTTPLSFESWIRIVLVALLAFIVIEFEKWCRREPFKK